MRQVEAATSSCTRGTRCSTSSWRTGARRRRRPEPHQRRGQALHGRRGRAGVRRLRQRQRTSCRRTRWARTSPRPGARTGTAPCSPTRATRRSTRRCIPVSGDHQSKLTLMSESLRNDGRVWVPKKAKDERRPSDIPEDERDYYLERIYPSFGNLVPRDIASRAAKNVCDEDAASAPAASASTSTSRTPSGGSAATRSRPSTATSSRCTSASPARTRTRRRCASTAVHYTMGGLWVDYDLESSIPGLFVIGEANFSDHGANRLGASALMRPGGRLLRPAEHHRRLHRPQPVRPGLRVGDRRGRGAGPDPDRQAPVDRRGPLRRLLPPRARPHHVEYCGMERTEEGCARPWSSSRRCARSSGRASRSPARARS